MKPDQLMQAADGAKIGALLPYLKAEIDQMAATIETRASVALKNSELTPELALSLWVEHIELKRVLRRFEQKVSLGVSAGEEIGPELNRQMAQRLAQGA